ncbi:MAG: cob(I)yrinic acid a,c-diamide adenosyltransferase [Candidatus Thermoplasmatota archaeon]|nr:ATP:cob(I)alamin adenosyltransferase [Euryarchaeota archaeon]MED5485378.1 cob(I)yrinic acid a,c-diamide adenosyltransferase [Candidatus Thermoplasmatota archaeon]|tara:strand:+ start:813 stop:1502 length:690 start_codon:yes stop_codon:yes gene_type:complete
MVRINRVHTGTGDEGNTSLVDGSRVPKFHPRLEVVGTLDELNSILGSVLMESNRIPERHSDGGERKNVLEVQQIVSRGIKRIQQELFDLGAELACPADNIPEGIVLLEQEVSDLLLSEMDSMQKELKPLESFILPGGVAPIANLHIARTVVRRTERQLIKLIHEEGEDSVRIFVKEYINRLSDWLFVLIRWVSNRLGEEEFLWVPKEKRIDKKSISEIIENQQTRFNLD